MMLPHPMVSPEVHRRFLTADECLASQVVPVTPAQSQLCGAPRLDTGDASERTVVRMAGNGMHTPCVGVFLLCAMLALELR